MAVRDAVANLVGHNYGEIGVITGASLLTPWADEARKAASSYGFTVDLGTPFTAATRATTGLSPVHRLYRSAAADFTWAVAGSASFTQAPRSCCLAPISRKAMPAIATPRVRSTRRSG